MTYYSQAEFEALFKRATLLSDLEEDQRVYKVDDKIIKVNQDPEEFINGLWVNQHMRPYFIKTYGMYVDKDGTRYLILEKANGYTLRKSLESWSRRGLINKKLDKLYLLLIEIIKDYTSLGFIHQDLHSDNIIVDIKDNQYIIKIIDYEYCCIDEKIDQTNRKRTINDLFVGLNNSVWDPIKDYIMLYKNFSEINDNESLVKYLKSQMITAGNDNEYKVVYKDPINPEDVLGEPYQLGNYEAVNDIMGPNQKYTALGYIVGLDDNTQYLDEYLFFQEQLAQEEIPTRKIVREKFINLKRDIREVLRNSQIRYLRELKSINENLYNHYIGRIGSFCSFLKEDLLDKRSGLEMLPEIFSKFLPF